MVLWILVWLYRDSLEIEGIPDKYVFVTGCDSGFGNLLCRKLDRRGFHVLAGCLTEKGADDLKRAAGPNLKTVLLNVTNEESIQKAMEWAKKEVGEKGEMILKAGKKKETMDIFDFSFKTYDFFSLRTLGNCEQCWKLFAHGSL